jgi:phosphatidylinositol glycan class B
LTGLLGWLSCVGLALRAREWFPKSDRAQRFCVYALALMWFLPALHVRPSSEALAGSAFLAGLVLLTSTQPGTFKAVLGGALLGLSFEARFQMGFMIVGLVAWMLWVQRPPFRRTLAAVAGLVVVFAIGRWIDRWGYGEWVLSPWRYVEYNLLRGEVNRYGRSPPWDVFRMAFTESWPFLGLTLAVLSVVAWIRHPRHPLTWSQVPFFLVHVAIAHKELRFFFPIAAAGPVLLTMALTADPSRGGEFTDPAHAVRGWGALPIRWYWRFLLLNDFIALPALLLIPFARPVQFYSQIWSFIPAGTQRFEILYRGTDPYNLLGNPVYFYRPPALSTRAFDRYEELVPRLAAGETLWVFDPAFTLPKDAQPIARDCRPAIRTLPSWVTHINFNGWLERAHPWTLFECRRGASGNG